MPAYSKEVIVFLVASNFIVAGFAVFSYFILRIQQKRKILHRHQLLEKEFETRRDTISGISRDLHDEIGSSLSGISVFSQLALSQLTQRQHNLASHSINSINQYTSLVIERTGDLVWMLQPENDSEEKYIRRLEHYAAGICSAKNIQLVFEISPGFHFPNDELRYRKNIYLICKEAINNAVKYSDCTQLQVKLSEAYISVADNGKGFDVNLVTPGNGLQNMQQRAGECNLAYTISSSNIKGTSVTIRL
jgi:signal transduction histidine kinase